MPFDYHVWRLAEDMHLDPDVLLAKPLKRVVRWLTFRNARTGYLNYRRLAANGTPIGEA